MFAHLAHLEAISTVQAKVVAAAAVDEEEPDEAAEAEQAAALSFDYLLSMAIQSLTLEKVHEIQWCRNMVSREQ